MSDYYRIGVSADHRVPVGVPGATVVITNVSGATLYYADQRQVSSTSNTGALTAGQNVTLATPEVWLISAGYTSVQIVSTPVSSGGGGGGGGGAPLYVTSTQQAGNYTFTPADAATVVEGTGGTPQTFTIPPNSSSPFPVGALIEVFQDGAGQIGIAGGAGVTLVSDGAKTFTTAQYATIRLRQRAIDEWVLSGDVGVSTAGPRITTTGASFSPSVELVGGSAATVHWVCEETGDTATGVNPTINFAGGTAVPRHVQMTVTGGGGIGDITTFNIGYDDSLEGSPYSLGAGHNHAAQNVSALERMNLLTGLVRFAAEQVTTLTSTLDFTGFNHLTNIEMDLSSATGLVTTGCTSLIRICIEQSNLSAIDLNPCKATLKDFRAAAMQGGALTLTPLTGPLAVIDHFCVRGQTVTNLPGPSNFPHVKQYWTFVIGQSGAFVAPPSDLIFSIQSYGNAYTSADLSSDFPGGRNASVDLNSCALTSINLTGCSGITSLYLQFNSFNQAAVDGVLTTANGWGTSGGTLDIHGTGNAAPSATGNTAKTALIGRGWTVTTN